MIGWGIKPIKFTSKKFSPKCPTNTANLSPNSTIKSKVSHIHHAIAGRICENLISDCVAVKYSKIVYKFQTMSISFSSECFRTKASRNFSVEDVDLITADLLAAILESALDLQTACQSRNQGVPYYLSHRPVASRVK